MMKHIVSIGSIIVATTIIFGACNMNQTKLEGKATIEIDSTQLATANLKVIGMTCQGCEKSITTKLNEIEGVSYASASHMDSLVVATFDKSQTSLEAIQEAIEASSYVVDQATLSDE